MNERLWALPVRRALAARLALGTGLLLGQCAFVAGAGWDIQWHVAIGRDRPLSPPHLLLLAGIALTGCLALASVLAYTALAYAVARARPLPTLRGSGLSSVTLPTVRFLGIFHAPLGAYLAGFGALLSTLAFPLDDYWHRLYGIDVTLWAPFHVMIVAGMALAALGTAYIFASVANATNAAHTADEAAGGAAGHVRLYTAAGGALGLALLAATLLLLLAQALDRDGIVALRPQPVILYPPLLAVFTIPWLVAAALGVRVPGGATLVALTLMLLRYGLFAFVPWAVRVTAMAEGLPFRPTAPAIVVTPLAFPAWIVLAGVVIDGVWWLVRTRRWRVPAAPALIGAGVLAAVFEAVIDRPWVNTLTLTRIGRGMDMQAALLTMLPWVALCGLIVAALGVGLGAALQRARA